MNNCYNYQPPQAAIRSRIQGQPSGPPLPRQLSPQFVSNHQSHPASRLMHPLVSPPKQPNYLVHLLPQQLHSHIHQTVFPHSPKQADEAIKIVQKQGQFFETKQNQNQENRSYHSNSAYQNRAFNNNSNGFSQTGRSKGYSQFQTQNGSHIKSTSNFIETPYAPQDPRNIAKVESIRRNSQYKGTITQTSDQKSNRSSSSHNIHITIQSQNEGQLAPTITISPNKKPNIQSMTATFAPSFAQNVITMPSPVLQMPNPTTINQTVISHQSNFPQQIPQMRTNQNQHPTVINHHHPIVFTQVPQQNQVYHSQASAQTQIKQTRNQQLYGSDLINNPRQSNRTIGVEKGSLSLSTNFPKPQIIKKPSNGASLRQEYYNQNIEQADQEDRSQYSRDSDKKHQSLSAYIFQQKTVVGARRLIDQIFENETNRALLQIKTLEVRSRQKYYDRKKHSRSRGRFQ